MSKVKVNPVIVRVEGTLSDFSQSTSPYDPGPALPGAADRLAALQTDITYVYLVSPLLNTETGVRILMQWLRANGIDAYDELWVGNGIPAGTWYDDQAKGLV